MPILKKTSFLQNLDQVTVFINDTAPLSQYFQISDLPDTFSGGKNSFLIQGSPQLVPDTLVKMEIKDATGKVIYSEPASGIPSYYEGTSKVVSVHVYPDTAFGPCTITILGELSQYVVDGLNLPIPANWEGKYNVKWQTVVNVNPFLTNTTPIRFYRRPKIEITESVLPIYSRLVSSTTNTGYINGTSILPIQDTDYKTYKGNIAYELSTTSSFFSQSMEGFNINISGLASSYIPKITDVINDKRAFVNIPYYITSSTTDPNYQRIKNFTNAPFSITYDESVSLSDSNINTSFAKIKISDLETFTGDAARIKVFATSKNDIAGYQLLEDVLLESNELLQVDEFNGALNVRTGIFSQPILDNYWITRNITTNVTTEIDNSLLIRSVKLTPSTDVPNSLNLQGLFKFEPSASIPFSKFTQYQLDFTPLMSSSLGNYALLEIYGSGSAFVNSDNNKKFGKLLGELESNYPFRRYDKQQINFQPDNDGDGKIVFLVKGGTWQISNVSLRAAQESSFSPNEISLVVNVPTKINNETFDFKFEIYDINNNYVPILLESSSTFTGGNDVAVTRDLQLNLSNNYFNFSTSSVVPSFITIDFTKTGLTGSVTFNSSAVDTAGNDIASQVGYPGALEVIDSDTYKLTVASFTGSINGVTIGAINYTASCEDINRYFTIFRTDQGAPAYLFYATADKNNFTFNPDDNYKSVITNDYIDIRLVQQNLPDTGPMGLVISSGSEAGVPPPLYYTSSLGNASIYRLFVSTSSDTTPSNKSGYTYAIGQSHYDFQLNTIDGVFTSSVTIDAIQRGSAAKALIATSDKNQFTYKMSDLTADPSPQTATILVKRQNLLSPSSSITVNSGSGKPALTLVSNNTGNGVAQYTISTTAFSYSVGSTTYYFTGSDANGVQYTSEISISPIISKAPIAVAASNENATLAALSTGFVASASFLATTGSLLVTVGNATASYSKVLASNTYSASISASSGVTGASMVSGTYSIGSLTSDSGSVTLAVTYQDGTGTNSTFSKIITYSKAKKSAPVLNFSVTNNNQSINAKSTGAQLSEFVTASLIVTESYDGINSTKAIVGTPTITTLYGYSNYSYNSTNQTIALRTLSTDNEQLNITANVVDSENITRTLFGSISLSKVRNAVPNVEVSLVPFAQTILANSRGSGSVTPVAITVNATEGGTSRFTSIGTPSYTNGLSASISTNTLTFTSNASSMSKDSGSITIPINYTDSEGVSGTKTIIASVTRVRSAAPSTTILVSPQTQTITSSSVGFATPQDVTLTLSEVGGTPYTYTSTLGSTVNTFSASVTNATINTSTGVITPNTPNTSLGVNASSLVTYINSEGTRLTSSVSYSVGVALEGNDGGQGPGVVYRGAYVAGTAYFHTDIRRDIVLYSGQYYLATNTAKSGLTTWGTPPTDWSAFGATFDSIATNILLTADATIARGLVMGTLDGNSGFIRSANATSLTAGKGYYFNYDGSFRFGDTGSSVVLWDGTNLTVSGTIKAQTGSIGGVTMSANSIFTGTGTYGNTNTGFFLSSSGHFSLEDKLSWDPINNYLNVSGTITATTGSIGGVTMSNAAIYAGAGTWNDKNTGFFISRSGHFSLEDKLTWDPATEYLNISGTLRASTGSLGGWTIDSDSIFSGTKRDSSYNQFNSASMVTIGSAGYISAPGFYITTAGVGVFSGSLRSSNGSSITTTGLLNFTQSIQQFTASVTQSLIDASSSISTSIATLDTAIYTNTNGLLDKSLGVMSGKTAGLYTGNEYFGYWNGTSWKSYIDSSGNMVLTGSSGNMGMAWNVSQNALSIDGRVVARSGLIGGWGVNLTQLSSSNVVGGGDDVFTTSGMIIGSTGYISAQNFKIASNGNASFSGSITGGNITIGTAPSVFKADLNGIYLGDGTFASAPFRVSPAGVLTATQATITGTITATDGFIGGWNINTNDISSDTAAGGGDGQFTSAGLILNKTGWISSEKFFISSSGEASFAGKITYGARGTGLNIAPIGMKYDPRDGNFLDYANITGVQSIIYTAPNSGSNANDYGLDPFGNNSLLWMIYPSGSAGGNADGGWNSQPFEIDTEKTYKFVIYVKRYQSVASGAGQTYWGCYGFDAGGSNTGLTRVADSATDTNPYFWYGIPPLLNRWYLIVGYIHGKSYAAGSTSIGGLYDTVTGEKINVATLPSSLTVIYDYKWRSDSKASGHRAYLYYNQIAGSPYTTKYQEFFGPAVYEVDGTEPDLNALLDKGKMVSNGTMSGSFISGSTFFSPKIAGNDGYFLNTIKVGTAANPITISGSGANPALYQGSSGQYANTSTGFYLDSNGRFSLKDRLVFDGTNLSIDGTINARSGIFSGSIAAVDGNIGGWIIDGNSLRDTNSNIKLNPATPSIEIYDTSDTKKVDIKQGALSNPASTDNLTIDPVASYAFSSTQYTATSWPGYGTQLFSPTYQTLSVTSTGLYYKASPAWSSDVTNFISSDSSFDGTAYIELFVQIHSSTTPTTSTLISSFNIAYTTAIDGPSQTKNLTTNNGPVSITLTAGTYYVFTTWILYGYIAGGSVTVTGTPNPASNASFNLQLDQIEITDNGILVVAGANNYARMARGTFNNTLDVYQNSSTYTGITVNNADTTNTNAGGLAINVTNGSVNIADKLFVQGMVTDPAGLTNLAVKAVTQAGTRYGEFFYSTSTRRNKIDIVNWEIDGILEKIKLVEPKKFIYKNWPSGSEKTLGIIAEDLRDYGLGDAASFEYDDNGNKTNEVVGIDWEKLSVILWKGVQELTDRVEKLEQIISGSI